MLGPVVTQALPPGCPQDRLQALPTGFARIQILEATVQAQTEQNQQIEAQVTIQRQQLHTAERLLTEASRASTQQHSQVRELAEAFGSQFIAQQDFSTAVTAMMARTERGHTPTDVALFDTKLLGNPTNFSFDRAG